MTGIDISNWQAGIDLSAVKPGFVVAKLAEGTTWHDPSFSDFYGQCKSSGIPMGAYVYSHATSAEGGTAEAKFALNALAGWKLELPLYLDIEADILNSGKAALMASALAFAETVRAAGYRPGVYASAYPLKTVLDIPTLRANGISIWCAAYNDNGPGVDCDIWQSSNTSRWPGYNGPLDKDTMIIDILGKDEPVYDDGKSESGLLTDDDDDIPVTPKLYKADMATLCRGFYGTQVIVWQKYLASLGYLDSDWITGIYDFNTQMATKDYQEDHGLAPDGMPGPKTYNA